MTTNKKTDNKDEMLRLEYVRLDKVKDWGWVRNLKLHDIGAIAESFYAHGFKDPAKFEPKLNNGKGGLVEGNGREEALIWMFDQGHKAPRGIPLDTDGMWLMPIIFGVDAQTEALAEAYGIDHNNTTIMGGQTDLSDIMKLWKHGFDTQILELAQEGIFTVSIPKDIVDSLDYFYGMKNLDDLKDEFGEPTERDFWPVISVQVSLETKKKYEKIMSQISGDDEAAKFDELISRCKLS